MLREEVEIMSWPVAIVISIFILALSLTVVTVIAILNIFKSPLKAISWQEIRRENESISGEVSNEVEEFYQKYKKEISNSNLSKEEKENYLSYAGYFVDWVEGDFKIKE